MTSLLVQSMHDRILWLLEDNGGKMERALLRRRIGWRYAILDPILKELEKEGRIKVTLGQKGSMISLKKMIETKF
jgi:DNA-binding HxlR family transcriptional regulator